MSKLSVYHSQCNDRVDNNLSPYPCNDRGYKQLSPYQCNDRGDKKNYESMSVNEDLSVIVQYQTATLTKKAVKKIWILT